MKANTDSTPSCLHPFSCNAPHIANGGRRRCVIPSDRRVNLILKEVNSLRASLSPSRPSLHMRSSYKLASVPRISKGVPWIKKGNHKQQ